MSVEPEENRYTFIDLFCGIGGFHQALANAGCECVFACDIDEKCRAVYEKNYRLRPESDITKIDIDRIPRFDILCGGFPCQSFSKAGFQRGFSDDRGNLFFSVCRIAERHRPRYMILENVRNLSSHDNGNTWRVIRESIINLGYYTYAEPVILNALHFDVPQNRERVIIMCKRMDLGELPALPAIPKNPKTGLTNHIRDIVYGGDEFNAKYRLEGKMKSVERIWDEFIQLMKTRNLPIPKFPIWTDWWDSDLGAADAAFYKKYRLWIDKNRAFYADNRAVIGEWLSASRDDANWVGAVRKFEWQAGDLSPTDGMRSGVLWTARGSGIRVKRDDYIPTLVAMSMIPVYGRESRRLNPRELLRLQSFPDTFEYDEKTISKQVGNSVNVKMIERSARFLVFGESLF
jgi:DNA (cytosine-5)-methyltransferase 1